MRPARLSRALHKWIALIVGIQALLWVVSGFYMVVVDLDFIHGDSLVRNLATPPPRSGPWISVNEVRARFAGLQSLRIKGLPGMQGPLFEIASAEGIVLLDGTTGERLSPLSQERVSDLARHYYAGSGSLGGLTLLVDDPPPLEIQTRRLPLWRAEFDDWLETTLYIHPDSGELITRRHRFWRWFDVFWMLHIMDYDDRQDVNNTLLKGTTLAGCVLAVSGLWLACFSFRRRRVSE